MANRIVERTLIIDSANEPITWPAAGMKVHTVTFWSANTTGNLELGYSENTTNIAVKIMNPNHFAATQDLHFGEPVWFVQRLNVNAVTAGTAWLYFC